MGGCKTSTGNLGHPEMLETERKEASLRKRKFEKMEDKTEDFLILTLNAVK